MGLADVTKEPRLLSAPNRVPGLIRTLPAYSGGYGDPVI